MRKFLFISILLVLSSRAEAQTFNAVGHNGGNSGTIAVTMGALTAGTTTIVVAGCAALTCTNSVPTDGGDTFTLITSCTNQSFGGSSGSIYVWEADSIAGGGAVTVTAHMAATFTDVLVVNYSGVAASAFDRGPNCNTGNAVTTWSTGTTSATSFTNELVIAVSFNNAATPGTPTGYNTRYGAVGTAWFDQIADKNVTATGTQVASGTMSSSGYMAAILTFKASSQPSATQKAAPMGMMN